MHIHIFDTDHLSLYGRANLSLITRLEENQIQLATTAINVEELTKSEKHYSSNGDFSEYSQFAGYEFSQKFEIESKSLNIIEKTSREIRIESRWFFRTWN